MMMPTFPFFRPNMYYNPYRKPYYNYNNIPNNLGNSPKYNNCESYSNNKTVQAQGLHPHKEDFTSNSSDSPQGQYFDIFGIRLYFDDILILCLLFFLYQEEVNDQLLFMALLLLLLS